MELDQVGIGLVCRCGANMSADIAGILFADKGRVKISGAQVYCLKCGAIYRSGEQLRYRLLFVNGSFGKDLKILNQEIKNNHETKKQTRKNDHQRYKTEVA